MAERIKEANYLAMLEALYNFHGRVTTLASSMQTLALVSKSALEAEDSAVIDIYKNINACTTKYSNLANEAMKLARDIRNELEEAKRERSVWSDDD